MILVTHGVIGGALTHRASSVFVAFCIGLLSHYLADAIPHWHYNSPKIKNAVRAPFGKKTLSLKNAPYAEIMRICVDLLIGISLSLLIFPGNPIVIFVGAMGAVLPDLLTGLSRFWPMPLLVLHERFHRWIHTNILLDDYPVVGIGSQILIAVIFIFLFR